MTVSITSSGIALDGPLVAGEKVAVTVSGLALAAEDKPTLALLARFPDALLASVELAEDAQTPGTWTGELDTATKQTALFFATARADERRDAALELVAGRVSLARLTVPMANSALCPKPDGSPFASPVYVPVPGPHGDAATITVGETTTLPQGSPATVENVGTSAAAILNFGIPKGDKGDPGDPQTPSDATPQMDGTGAAGTATTYARGDHQHPSDTSRVSRSGDIMEGTLSVVDETAGTAVAAGSVRVNNQHSATVYGAGAITDSTNQKTLILPANNGTLALQECITPAFSSSSTYAVGDYCTHDGLLYKCTTAVTTAAAWNAANWTAVAVTDEMGADTPLPFDAECEYVTFPAGAYVDPEIVDIGLPNAYDIDARIRIPTYGSFRFGNWREDDQTKSFMIFNYSGGGYKLCKYWADSGSGIAQTSDFFQIKTQSNSYTLNGTTRTCTPTTTVRENASFIICGLDNKVDGQKGGSEVDIDIAYFRFIGNTVLRDLVPVRVGQVGYLYDKISGRLFGSAVGSIPLVPGPDKAQPTITTPGRIVELTPAIRYAFASPTTTVSGTTATVACEDRAINDFTIATGITSLTITPPAAVTGRARDFFCRVTLTDASLPTVTLSGGTIDIGATEVAGMTQGVNLLMFTEIASGHWLASRRSA